MFNRLLEHDLPLKVIPYHLKTLKEQLFLKALLFLSRIKWNADIFFQRHLVFKRNLAAGAVFPLNCLIVNVKDNAYCTSPRFINYAAQFCTNFF